VLRRVEAGTEVVAPSKAELVENAHGLFAHCLYADDDRARIGFRVVKCSLKVVDYGQPQPRHPGPRIGLGPADLAGAPLACVVQISQRAQPLIFELSDPGGGRFLAVGGYDLRLRLRLRVRVVLTHRW